MKPIRIFTVVGIVFFLYSCVNQNNGLDMVNSESFPDQNIVLDPLVNQRLAVDRISENQAESTFAQKIDEIANQVNLLKQNPTDNLWNSVSTEWIGLEKEITTLPEDSTQTAMLQKWANLNIQLLKLSGEVRFGDALENLFYKHQLPVLTEKQLKSVIYTHVDDQIFVNVLASSSVTHHHTTGGTVRLIQQTGQKGNEMILRVESGDVRYMDVFIRIPSWAVNPTVTHGNVKYVARPGEYCEIPRKWKNGDEITVTLAN
jgi:hypothetical protein